MAYKSGSRKSTDLSMRGTAGRDCSPKSHQQSLLAGSPASGKAPKGSKYAGLGTSLGGDIPENGTSDAASGARLDPALYNVDLHAVRMFSRYMEGKRAGPDWLHKRTEDAQRQRLEEGLDLMRGS